MNKLEPIFEKVKYNALDYIGIYQEPVSDLASILFSVVEQNGIDVLFNTELLWKTIVELGVEELEVHRICLMTQVTGLREVVNRDPRTAQLDLDRYIQNAIEETGLNRDTILRITSAIAYATGGDMSYKAPANKGADHITEKVATLADAVCQDNLEAFKEAFEQVVYKKSSSTILDFEILEPLVNYGLPNAKYFLGYCLLNGIQLEVNEARGIELLQEAADAGDSKASATLGDYYFSKGGTNNWTKAYDYYTGYGAIALNKTRKNAIVSILNHKLYNKKILELCIVLFIAMVATVIWSPATTVFAAHAFWGWCAVILQFALLILEVLNYKSKPYDCVYILPVAMASIWFIYMAIRLLF